VAKESMEGKMRVSQQPVFPGGSMCPGYVLQLLFCGKSQNYNSPTTKARAKINADLESLKLELKLDLI
jgi:hypothetical protein